jgi:uncharacterized protein (TIGR03118 family)
MHFELLARGPSQRDITESLRTNGWRASRKTEWRYYMKQRLSGSGRLSSALLAALTIVASGSLTIHSAGARAAPAGGAPTGTVLQTNLVSDLPGAAAVQDPNLVNSWGLTESSTSPFWVADNGSGLATTYLVPGVGNAPVSINSLVVNIPTPVSPTGAAPTGTVFNIAASSGAFRITGPNNSGQTASAPATFLFDTEDGTIVGWNPGIDPTRQFGGPNGVSNHAIIAVDNSGNNFTNPNPNQQTGAVYKGLGIATSSTPIIATDPASTALLYASNFRAGTVEVYDANFTKVTDLPASAFKDPGLPAGFAPFNIQVLNGKVYVTYALQNAVKHDDVAGLGHGFIDVFNLDGTPGLPGGAMRLTSRGPLNSPWGLAIAPPGFAGISNPSGNPVLLVGNFGDGFIHAFDAVTGSFLGQLTDPDGEPIQIDGLWALRVGNGAAGGFADTVYFTSGPFGETHGLFGSLTTAALGSPEGPAEAQLVQANADVVQLALQRLTQDISSGASAATIRQDIQAYKAASRQLVRVAEAFARNTEQDRS